ncbi:quinolinate synthetase complex, A subunit [Methanocella conradii HZ254]|uniref:Quinolinate synthase n=1 Tax=Methanocella conradii (strain DSM 24694 / JCM 17849 / CGMCC 1.5162 / HZ254) TaxID=1041930 RepID=H8I526_METCZ|nr:quinolinate synthase NadA [Methanocella conradii]AFC98785.1 quinolinate synthetase complex, A subunit [Methanocella conradii HZ254]
MSIIDEVIELKKARRAVILAHNYQRGEVQDIADYVGDSFGLSQKAVDCEAEVIVFCGVDFMAESAAILNPDKIVLNPAPEAGCPMARMITAADVKMLKNKYPGAEVVCYVNSSAEVKAESDVCCTSSNAVKVVNSLKGDEAIFVPDRNLAHYAQKFTSKRIHAWQGYCPTHHLITAGDVLVAKMEHPGAEVIVHPECRPEVVDMADGVFSTDGMIKYAKNTGKDLIIGTESGIIHRLMKENPGIRYYPLSPYAVCPNMKMNSLETVRDSLRYMKTRIVIPENIRTRAKKALDRMLEVGR